MLKSEYHILNLGAGVQSTTLYLMSCQPDPTLYFDYAIFGDTQAEPKAVYQHLAWLREQDGPPILIDTKGSLKHHLIHGQNADGKRKKNGDRFASIPAFTAKPHETRGESYDPLKEAGRVKRQCTSEYKIEVVERVIRRQILGRKPRQRIPKGITVYQSFGITVDEARRMVRLQERFAQIKWAEARFPLIDLSWTRKACMHWLKDRVPHTVPRSACTFCPFKDDVEWAHLKNTDPDGWQEAVEVDRAIRETTSRCARRLTDKLYLHRQCIPLEMVDLSNPAPSKVDNFSLLDCLGMCGN